MTDGSIRRWPCKLVLESSGLRDGQLDRRSSPCRDVRSEARFDASLGDVSEERTSLTKLFLGQLVVGIAESSKQFLPIGG